MTEHQKDTNQAVKPFFRAIFTKFEDTFNLSWKSRKVEFIYIVLYTATLVITLEGLARECQDSYMSGDGNFVSYFAMFPVILSELSLLLAKHTLKIEEYPHACDLDPAEKKIIIVNCLVRLLFTIYLVACRHDLRPGNLKNEGIQSVHLRMMRIFYLLPVISLTELYMTVRKLSDGEKAMESSEKTHEFFEG